MRGSLALALVLLTPAGAWAYPSFVGKSYTNCVTCHYSPTGGGMVNSYGHAVTEATFPDVVKVDAVASWRDTLAHRDVTGTTEDGVSAFQWDLGLDTRLLFLNARPEENSPKLLVAIPMLMEVGAVAAYGPVLAYAVGTVRPPAAEGLAFRGFSREYWLGVHLGESLMLRAGRMMQPFGIRVPDHTLYTRTALRMDKWDQTYGAELDLSTEDWMVAVQGGAGDFLEDPKPLREAGGTLTLARNFASRGAVGVSALWGTSDLADRWAAGLFARVRVIHRAYVLAEVDRQQRTLKALDRDATNYAWFARAGWFALESLDLYAEHARSVLVKATSENEQRTTVGADWHALPWVELAPAVRFDDQPGTGVETTAMLQLHVSY